MTTKLITVSDDRFGRKHGAATYKDGQRHMAEMFSRGRGAIGLDYIIQYNIKECIDMVNDCLPMCSDIDKAKVLSLLDLKDPALNGRVYKPLIIFLTLQAAKEGDIIIYNDCSYNMWDLDTWAESEQKWSNYHVDVLRDILERNGGIVSPFVRWGKTNLRSNDLGYHTHFNFTTDLCMHVMNCFMFKYCYQHASGMMAFVANEKTREFASEWLKYNIEPMCCALGIKEGDYIFADQERNFKKGHRHDQSISGLLINKYDYQLVMPPDTQGMNMFNMFNYMRKDWDYELVSSLGTKERFFPHGIEIGDKVRNVEGNELFVFDVEEMTDIEKEDIGETHWYLVGGHPFAQFKTIAQYLTVI
jgi:hypothetical protein